MISDDFLMISKQIDDFEKVNFDLKIQISDDFRWLFNDLNWKGDEFEAAVLPPSEESYAAWIFLASLGDLL